MTNPNNTSQLIGRLCDTPYFNKRKDGTEFGCSFTLAVRRSYKNKAGEYEADFIPVRYDGEKRMGFAHKLKKGDAVVINGPITTAHYTKDGAEIYTIFVKAEAVSFCIGNSSSSKPKKEEKKEEFLDVEELPDLPY